MTPPLVGVELGHPGDDPRGWLAEATAYEEAGVDSLWIGAGAHDPWVLLGALAAVTWRVRLGTPPGPAPGPAAATVQLLGRGRLVDDGARWVRVEPPPGRPAWAEALAAAAAAGHAGVVVPAAPGLLDLLRNPEAEDDRSDLQLTYG
ncbi:MAG TPA: LLM class flavin-dependent oxidoreductase [Candidatus Dormibacteraeota bacterium]|nr:LLM class flavin-dependent oxidoreductase [Candidatus Dormibacteraeota bacterium]